MTRVLYPGSFDPIHNGHLEVIEVATDLWDEVVVAVVGNPDKGGGLFTLDERVELVTAATEHLPNVSVTLHSSLVVDLARKVEADFILKGLRAVSDFESELQQAQMNHAISGVHTVFLPSATTHSFVASRLVREIARLGGDISSTVPPAVQAALIDRFGPAHPTGETPR